MLFFEFREAKSHKVNKIIPGLEKIISPKHKKKETDCDESIE